MKFALLLSLFFLLVQSQADASSRSNGLLRFLVEQEGLRDLGLAKVIGTRCSRYMDPSDKTPCKEAVKKMIQTLDYDIIITDDKRSTRPHESWKPSSFVFVAFKTNLINLLSLDSTNVYLNDLNQKLYKYLVDSKSTLNVWDVTKTYFKTDYKTAMAMATLFQDTSMMKLHLAYLERSGISGNIRYQSNKELLSRVIDTINLILDSSEDHYRELFYPEEIKRDLNRNIYHFYVPLFLAKSLHAQGVADEHAYAASLMLTLSYEFITSSQDYRYLFLDPLTMTNLHNLKDIFGGYCGSNIGLRGMNFNRSFEAIRASFERSTEDGVGLLLKH
jgi:hypothetical protein